MPKIMLENKTLKPNRSQNTNTNIDVSKRSFVKLILEVCQQCAKCGPRDVL